MACNSFRRNRKWVRSLLRLFQPESGAKLNRAQGGNASVIR